MIRTIPKGVTAPAVKDGKVRAMQRFVSDASWDDENIGHKYRSNDYFWYRRQVSEGTKCIEQHSAENTCVVELSAMGH